MPVLTLWSAQVLFASLGWCMWLVRLPRWAAGARSSGSSWSTGWRAGMAGLTRWRRAWVSVLRTWSRSPVPFREGPHCGPNRPAQVSRHGGPSYLSRNNLALACRVSLARIGSRSGMPDRIGEDSHAVQPDHEFILVGASLSAVPLLPRGAGLRSRRFRGNATQLRAASLRRRSLMHERAG